MMPYRFESDANGRLTITDGVWRWVLHGERSTLPPVIDPSPPTPPPAVGRVWDARLDARGVTLRAASPVPSTAYWRLVRAEYRNRDEAGGKHHIHVDVLDEAGHRIPGVKLIAAWDGGQADFFSEEKRGEEAAANYPMFAAGWAYRVRVDGVSDEVAGMGLGDIGSEQMAEHVAYVLVFQRTRG